MFQTLNHKHTPFAAILLILLLVVSPFYSQLNAGGSGLWLPFNLPQWGISAWVISYALLLLTQSKKIIIPIGYYYFSIFPLIVLLTSLLADTLNPITWLFRQLYILGGFFFLFSLFQLRLKQRVIETILFLFVLATSLHSAIGLQQIIHPNEQFIWFLSSGDGVPRGIFQQINIQVSYISTGLVISLFLISRPFFRTSSLLTKAIFLFSFGLSIYVVIYSGSRVGLLSMIVGLPLVLISRRKQLSGQKVMLAFLLLATTSSVLLAQKGVERSLQKSERISDGEYSSARMSIYSIAIDIAKKEPLHGHGIGSFLRVWNEQAAKFIAENPSASLPEYVTHPHNELLFWLIEGGVAALIGILLVIVGIFIALYRCGFQRGGSYAAMLLPISLHTQVELPFYTSAVHWFLWLFLIFIILHHNQKTRQIHLSASATKLLQLFALSFAIIITYFMIHCARSRIDIYNYLHDPKVKPPYLKVAHNNLYFRPLAEKVAMRTLIFNSLENNDRENTLNYLTWAGNHVNASPEPEIYSDLAKTATYLKTDKKACELATEGAQMYPRHEELQEAAALCLVNMKKLSN